MQSTFAECFPYASPSAASAALSENDVKQPTNPAALKAVSATLDALATISTDVQQVATFINLHIPKMEDGNNFGVTVQLSLLKQISDLLEAIVKMRDDLSQYPASRAEALEKLKLPSSSSTTTKSTSSTTTDGKKEEKSSESTENKETVEDTSGPAYTCRIMALVSVDTLYYTKAQTAFSTTMSSYLSLLDFMDKNREKIEKPKGSGGSHSGYSSM